MDKNINLLQLLENCAERMKQQDREEREKDPLAYAKKWNTFFKNLEEKLKKESEKRIRKKNPKKEKNYMIVFKCLMKKLEEDLQFNQLFKVLYNIISHIK